MGARTERADPFDPVRLGAESIRRYMRARGLSPRKGFSQNFLVSGDVLEAIVRSAEPTTGRRILEVGPGLGVLTGALLAAGAAVTAVEIDRSLLADLRDRLADPIAQGEREPGAPGSLRLVEGDVLDIPVAELVAPPYDLVANLPYHITSPVLHHVLDMEPRPERFVLMLQREVAERIASPPGGMSYLSVFVQYHATVRIARLVPPEAFEPPPEVASAVVVGVPRQRRLSPEGEAELWRVVQAAFRERRKMLHNVLPRQLPSVGRERFESALRQAGIAPDRRPQTVAVEEWLALAAALGPLAPAA